MGGKKKLSLKQMERMQQRKDKREGEKRKASSSSTDKKSSVIPPNSNDENVIKEIKRMKILTPYTVASRFDLRLSVAKDLLEELHEQGVVTYVSGGGNIRIYKPSD